MGALVLVKPDPKLEDILMDEKPEGKINSSFIVDTIEKAAWAAGKFIEAQSRVEERLIQNGEFKDKIDRWSEKANIEDISTLDYMKSILEPYAKKMVHSQKNSKNLKLPGAKVIFRTTPETVEVMNEEVAISFCETNHPNAVETKKVLIKQELKKLLSQGSIIPGIKMKSGSERMYIKDIEEKTKKWIS